ncbi:hypothetical protein JKG47_21655 [Acidithiobacillus sp. MC6.1]|nr:hypothetical protein [Acidithiobacillus sp. MC6.1]
MIHRRSKGPSCHGPALLDVKVNRMELVMPPEVQIFVDCRAATAIFGTKAILSSRADEKGEYDNVKSHKQHNKLFFNF